MISYVWLGGGFWGRLGARETMGIYSFAISWLLESWRKGTQVGAKRVILH